MSQGNSSPPSKHIEEKARSLPDKLHSKKTSKARSLPHIHALRPSTSRRSANNKSSTKSARRRKYELMKYRFTQKSIRPVKFLEKMCMDSGYCMAFGREKERIRNFFDDMNFKHLDGEAERVGVESNNGIVHMLKYTKDNYSTYAIMKSSVYARSDILLYEYIVGKYFINNYVSKYPCFMETYGLYQYTNMIESVKTFLKMKKFIKPLFWTNPKHISKSDEKRVLDNFGNELEKRCKLKNKEYLLKYAILIEYVKEPITLDEYMDMNHSGNIPQFLQEVINILLQVYIPLGKLMNSFTHNDLHTKNVLLYKVPNNQYVEMRYYMEGRLVTIRTQYIAKVIDYGRCFFRSDQVPSITYSGNQYNLNSEGIADIIHIVDSHCETMPLKKFLFFDKNVNSKNAYTSAAIGNISRDMNLVGLVFSKCVSMYKKNPTVNAPMESFLLYLNEKVEEEYLGSIMSGMPKTTQECEPKRACNVETLRDCLIDFYVDMEQFKYDETARLGVMSIYDDGRDMLFVKE